MVCALRLRSVGIAVLRRSTTDHVKIRLGLLCGETSALGDYYVATNVLGDHFALFNSDSDSDASGLWVTEE